MHPYQDQVNRMWDLIKLKIRAQKNGFWIEALDLSYILLEIELRLLLSSKAGNKGRPIDAEKIDKQEYLMSLANLAKDRDFIDKDTWDKLQDFNDVRRKTIHKLAQGEITYDQLAEPVSEVTKIVHVLQEQWLPIKIGKVEKA